MSKTHYVHVNCFDQGFKHLIWGWRPSVFTKFKAIFGGW